MAYGKTPGVPAALVRGIDIGQKLMADHLDGLRVERIAPLGVLLEVVLGWPLAVGGAAEDVEFLDVVPQTRRLHLRGAQPGLHLGRFAPEAMDGNGLHVFTIAACMVCCKREKRDGRIIRRATTSCGFREIVRRYITEYQGRWAAPC